jgi:hypothetical protein
MRQLLAVLGNRGRGGSRACREAVGKVLPPERASGGLEGVSVVERRTGESQRGRAVA